MKRLALTKDGQITYCYSTEENIGKGRCPHIAHQENSEEPDDFLERVKNVLDKDTIIIKNEQEIKDSSSQITGAQMKFYQNNKFIKIDLNSFVRQYNGLAEEICSNVLDFCNIPHAHYKSCKINLNGITYNGCFSENFLKDGEEVVSIESIISNDTFNEIMYHEGNDLQKSFDSLLQDIEERFGIDKNISKSYILKLISFDLIVLNRDRHLGNLNLIKDKDGNFKFAPVFDNGDSLLLSEEFKDCDEFNFWNREEEASPTTFGIAPMDDYFDLISNNISSKNDILMIDYNKLINHLDSYQNNLYDEKITKRSIEIIKQRLEEFEKVLWIRMGDK